MIHGFGNTFEIPVLRPILGFRNRQIPAFVLRPVLSIFLAFFVRFTAFFVAICNREEKFQNFIFFWFRDVIEIMRDQTAFVKFH